MGIVVTCLLLSPSVFAANILVTQSQTEDHPDLTMDAAWQDLANQNGHNAQIYPSFVLANPVWLDLADIVIVSSGIDDIPDMSYTNLRTFVEMGKSVYIQCESDPLLSTNERFAQLVAELGGAFTWGETTPGDLIPMNILGELAIADYEIETLDYFLDGCTGFGDDSIENQFEYGGEYYGFMFDPPDPMQGLVLTNTDQDWVNQWAYQELMSNYLALLSDYLIPRLQLDIHLTSPAVIPPEGGILSGYATIQNLTNQWITFDGWVDVLVPPGFMRENMIVIRNMVVGPFDTFTTPTRYQEVSAGAPAGGYTVYCYVGIHDITTYDFAVFVFMKEGAGTDGQPSDDWTLFSMDEGLDENDMEAVPDEFKVRCAYPNPFNAATTIRVELREAADLKVAVYNVAGQQVAELMNGWVGAGTHHLTFDASDLTSGLYFIRTSIPGEFDQIQKVMLVR